MSSPSFSRKTRLHTLTAWVVFAVMLVAVPATASAMPEPSATVEATCVDESGVIAFTMTGGEGGTDFTYRVSGLQDRVVSVDEGETVTRRRSGRREGVAYAASVLSGGVLVASESVRISCGAPLDVPVVISGLCVDDDGRIRTEITNNTAGPLNYSIDLIGAEVPPFAGTLAIGESTSHTRSGRSDRIHEVLVTSDLGASTWPVEIACDDPGELTAIIESYCEASGGVIAFRLRAGAQPATFVVSVSGLDDRIVEVAPAEMRTTLRTGRPDGDYLASVSVAGQVIANASVPIDCVPDPAIAVTVGSDCADGGGRIGVTVTNNGAASVSFAASVRNVDAAPLVGEVAPGEEETVYRTGRRDGDWVVDVSIDEAPPETFRTTVDCDGAELQPAVDVVLECVDGNGSIIVDVRGGGATAEVTVSVSGLDDRSVTVAPGEVERIYRSGRPDGTYRVQARTGDTVLVDQSVVVTCDPDPDAVGFFVDVTCADGSGVFTITLENSGPSVIDYSVTTQRAQVPPFEGTLEPGESTLLRRTGRLDGPHVVIAMLSGTVEELPVVVDCAAGPGPVEPTPEAGTIGYELSVGAYNCRTGRAAIGVDVTGNPDPVQYTVLIARQPVFNGRDLPGEGESFRNVGPYSDGQYQLTLEVDGAVVATGVLEVACVNPAPTAVPVPPTATPSPEPPTPEPTPEPTTGPTAVPTVEPTPEPTAVPTVESTPEPTVVPTSTAEPFEPEMFVTSHDDGAAVDTSPAGAPDGLATGSFDLTGQIPPGAARIELVGEQGGDGDRIPVPLDAGATDWSIELAPRRSGPESITVVALDAVGAVLLEEEITLDLVAPEPVDMLFEPSYVEPARLDLSLEAYSAETTIVVYTGEGIDALRSGHVIVAQPSDLAPDGFIRIIKDTRIDGDRVIATTTQGGLLDVFRQVDVDINADDVARGRAAIGRVFPYGEMIEIDGVKVSLSGELATQAEFVLDIDWCVETSDGGNLLQDVVAVVGSVLFSCPTGLGEVETFRFEASASVDQMITLSAEFKKSIDEGPEQLVALDIGAVTVGPVTITFGFEAEASVFLELAGRASITQNFNLRIGAGYELIPGDPGSRGWYYFPEPDAIPPTGDVEIDLGLEAMGNAAIDFNVTANALGLVGPQAGISLRANLNASAELAESADGAPAVDYSIDAYPSLALTAGIDLNFFSGKVDLGELLDFDPTFDLFEWRLGTFYMKEGSVPVLACGDNENLIAVGIDISRLGLNDICPDAPDGQIPTIIIDEPADPTVRDVLVMGTADDDAGVQFVSLVVEGPTGRYWNGTRYVANEVELTASLDGSLGDQVRGFEADLDLFDFGQHTVTATAVDTSGNESEPASIEFFVFGSDDVPDVTNPRITIDTDDARPEPDESFAITGEVSDDIDVLMVEVMIESADGLWWDGVAFVEEESSVTASLSGGPLYTWTTSFTPPDEGTYTITATATDESENAASVTESLNAQEPPPARLAVDISADPLPAEAGSGLALTYAVEHFGTETISGVSVLIELPEGLSGIGLAPGCEAQANPLEVLCVVGPVDVDEVREFGMTATVDAGADIDSMIVTATVFSVSPLESVRDGQDALRLNGATFGGIGSWSPPGCFGCDDSRSWGDPHLVTFDGLGYDFQTVGEFTLYRSADGTQEVQARHRPWRTSRRVSTNGAVAALVGGDRVMVLAGQDGVFVNDELVELASGESLDLGGGAGVSRRGSRYTIGWPGVGDARTRLVVGNNSDFQNIELAVPKGFPIVGLLGDRDGDAGNDLQLADGTVLSQPVNPTTLYGPYADDWRVTDATSLFTYEDGDTTETFTDLSFPDGLISVADLDPEERALAEAICRAAGVTNAAVLDACILDVVLTGDSGFALGAISGAIPKVAVQSSYLEDFEDGTAEGWSANIVGTAESGATKFFGPQSADNFTLTLTELPPHSSVNIAFDLNILGPWDGDATAFSAVADDDAILVDATFSNTAGAQDYPSPGSPAQSSASSVDDLGDYSGGGSATYRISAMVDRWEPTLAVDFGAIGTQALEGQFWAVDNVSVSLERVLPEVFAYEVGQSVAPNVPQPGAGSLEVPRAEDTYLFFVEQAATELLVDFGECPGGGLPWELRDQRGEIVVRGGCTSTYVYVAEPGEYSLRVFSVDAESVGDYSFVVTEAERLAERVPYSQTVLDDGPIRFQRFEAEAPEDQVADGVAVAYSDNAMLSVAAAPLSEPSGTALGSSGGSAAATFSSDGLPTGTDPFTIETWFRGYEDVGWAWLARYGGTVGLQYNDAPNGGELFAAVSGASSGRLTAPLPSGLRLADGQWHHVALTYDGATLVVYVDGFAAGSGDVTPVEATDAAVEIGFHPGDYDEFAIYGRALSSREISEHFAGGSARSGATCAAARTDEYSLAVREAGAVGHYPLDDRLAGIAVSRGAYDAVAGCLNGSMTSEAEQTDGPSGELSAVRSPNRRAIAFAPAAGLPSGGESRSIELWFRGSEDVGWAWLARYGGSIGLQYNDAPAGAAIFASLSGASQAQADFVLPGNLRLSDDTWHHVVLTYDGATDVMSVFVDSLLVGQTVVDGTLLDPLVQQGLVVGAHPGDYADVAVYASALTAEQVSEHYTLGFAPGPGECSAAEGDDRYAQAVLSDAPIGYLPLDPMDAPGMPQVAYDASSACVNGSFATGAIVVDGPGVSAGVASGAGGAAAFAGWPQLPAGEVSRSVELWFRGSEDVGWAWLARYGRTIGLQYNDAPAGGSIFASLAGDGAARTEFVLPGIRLSDGQWHHVALTYDGESDVLSIYVDSLLIGQATISGTLLDEVITQGLVVGGHPGDYAHVAIYESALTAAQISRHFSLGLQPAVGSCVAPTGADVYGLAVVGDSPVGYAPLTNTAGQDVAYDLSTACVNGSFATDALAVSDGPGGASAVGVERGTPVGFAGWSGLPAGEASRSVELWFRGAGDVGWAWLARYNRNVGLQYNDAGGGGSIFASLAGARAAQAEFALPGIRLSDGQWHHLVLTYDDASDGLSVYVDSLLVGQATVSGAFLDDVISQGLVVGGHPGDYAHVAVYPSALTADQVSRHYTLGIAPQLDACSTLAQGDTYGALVLEDAPVGYTPLDRVASREVAFDVTAACVNGSFATTSLPVADGPGGTPAVGARAGLPAAFSGWPDLPAANSSRSVELWFRGFEDVAWAWLARYGASLGVQYNDALFGAQLLAVLGAANSARATFTLPAGVRLSDGGWHHVVMTYDRESDVLSMYVDSQLIGEASIDSTLLLGEEVRRGLIVGSHPGDYAHVAVYDEALSPERVAAHFDALGGG